MKKILLIKHGSLGDIVFALPVMLSIYKHFSSSRIDILTQKKYFSFFKNSGYFSNLIEDNRSANLFINLNILLKIFMNRYDLVIDLQNSNRTSYYNFFLRIFSKAIISSSRNFAQFRYEIPIQGKETTTQGLFNQVKIINIKEFLNPNFKWLLTSLDQKYDSNIVLIIPGVSKNGKYKQWDPDKFAKIAKYCEEKNYKVCVIGTNDDYESIKPILNNCKNIINNINNSPPNIIYSIAKKSKLIISNDTGPGHIASLAGNNILWLANDNKISKSNIKNDPRNFKILSNNMENILVKDVIDLIEKNFLL